MNRHESVKSVTCMLLITGSVVISEAYANQTTDSRNQSSTLLLWNDFNRNGAIESTEIATVPANAIDDTNPNTLVVDLNLVQGYMPAREPDEFFSVVVWNDTNSDEIAQAGEITVVPAYATHKTADNALVVEINTVQGYMPARQ